eukprot:45185-Prymnesium_polylepis.1
MPNNVPRDRWIDARRFKLAKSVAGRSRSDMKPAYCSGYGFTVYNTVNVHRHRRAGRVARSRTADAGAGHAPPPVAVARWRAAVFGGRRRHG